MDWFRLYSEFATDAKVQMMPEVMQRRLIMLFCLQCSNGIETFHETERETSIAFFMRISDADLAATKELFLRRGFINSDWSLRNWNKRQYVSDSSTARVRKHRAAKSEHETKGETDVKRSSNAPEQNRTDTDKNKEKILSGKPDMPAGFASFWSEWPGTPRKVAKAKCLERWRKAGLEAIAGNIVAHVHREKAENQQWRDGYEPAPMTYLNQRRWEDGEGLPAGHLDGWWMKAGFESRFEAENAGCNQFICDQFRDGKRIGVPA
jgi:hypothetical protein